MENNIFIGNLVSFEDTQYFVELFVKKTNRILYKLNNTYYVDITEVEDENIEEYILSVKDDRTKLISNLPVCKIFVDESSLEIYNPKTYKLVR